MSFKVTDFGTNRKPIYDFLAVINSNLPPILHRFRDVAVDRSATPLVFNSPGGGVPLDDLREIFSGCQWMARVPNAVETLLKI